MARPEAALQQRISARLKQRQMAGELIWWTKLFGNPTQKRGLPDLLVVYEGFAVFFELKSEKGRPTKLQALRKLQIEKARAVCEVVRSVAEVDAVLDSMKAR